MSTLQADQRTVKKKKRNETREEKGGRTKCMYVCMCERERQDGQGSGRNIESIKFIRNCLPSRLFHVVEKREKKPKKNKQVEETFKKKKVT